MNLRSGFTFFLSTLLWFFLLMWVGICSGVGVFALLDQVGG